MSKVIYGKETADQILSQLKKEVLKLKEFGIWPTLHIVLVGDDPASKTYVSVKGRKCSEVGINFELEEFPSSITEKNLIKRIKELNENKKVNGIIVQLPLPPHIEKDKILETIDPKKDVDALTPYNLGRLVLGKEELTAATSKGIIKLLEANGIKLDGKNVVIINRSINVGKPLIHLLLNRNSTVTVCHSKTKNLEIFTKSADIVICAVGKPNFLKNTMIKEGSIVIDVGLTYVNGKGLGDVDFSNVSKKASYITPVPGGVGPMTVALILENTIIATKKQTIKSF